MMIRSKNSQTMDLCAAIASLSSAEEVQAFLIDLCTPQELSVLTQRFAVARMLWEEKNYSEITETTASSAASTAATATSWSSDEGNNPLLRCGRTETAMMIGKVK